MSSDRKLVRLDDVRDVPFSDPEGNGDGGSEGEQPPHSWKPIDLVVAGAAPPEPPTISEIVYPERVHVWSGEPETLKSLVAMVVGLVQARLEQSVMYVDLENGPRETTSRLRALGALDEELARILYFTPSEPLATDILAETLELIEKHKPSVCFIDSYTGSLAIHGCDPNSAIDVERHHQTVVNPLRSHGAAIVLLDHLVKNRENRGRYSIGSERKIGVAEVHLSFDLIVPLSRGGRGIVKLVTHKDRPGYLHRPKAAEVEFESDAEGQLSWEFTKVVTPIDPVVSGAWRPTELMDRISRFLEHQEDEVSAATIEDNVYGKAEFKRKAINFMVSDGYARETKGPRGARHFRLLQPFDKLSVEAKIQADLVPTSSRDEVATSSLTSSRRIPFTGAESDDLVPPRPTSSRDLVSTSSQNPLSPLGGAVLTGRGQKDQKNETLGFEEAPFDEGIVPREEWPAE